VHVRGPIRNAAVRIVGGKAEAGTIKGEQANVAARCKVVEAEGLETRCGEAVEIDERRAGGIAVFCVP